ncbi:MAG: tetratricopeptide repeat protein [Treponema sp.]|jgi:tetratricopeptide (TPR) repeat protein|nr:tetratricopeptide repeat protein [Treponema sp.]
MNAQFTTIIQTLIAEQGKEALINSAKCKAFLADYTRSEFTKERRLLLQVVEAGTAKVIAETSDMELCKKQQARYLQEELFLAPEIATDVVDMLAFVLRGDTSGTQRPGNKPKPPKPPTPSPKPRPPDQPNIDQMLDKVFRCMDKEDYTGVIRGCTEIIRIAPDTVPASAYGIRGVAHDEMEEHDLAIADYSKAISLEPDNGVYYQNRGYTYVNTGRLDRAINDFEEAIKHYDAVDDADRIRICSELITDAYRALNGGEEEEDDDEDEDDYDDDFDDDDDEDEDDYDDDFDDDDDEDEDDYDDD